MCIVVGALCTAGCFYWWYSHVLASRVTTRTVPDTVYQTKDIIINNVTIHTLIADTDPLRELGLGGRDGLDTDTGMFFVFQKDGIYPFWMKDMRFSIDMIWISHDKKIIYMAQNIAPSTYPMSFGPQTLARYVLEVPANYAVQHGFMIGDAVSF